MQKKIAIWMIHHPRVYAAYSAIFRIFTYPLEIFFVAASAATVFVKGIYGILREYFAWFRRFPEDAYSEVAYCRKAYESE